MPNFFSVEMEVSQTFLLPILASNHHLPYLGLPCSLDRQVYATVPMASHMVCFGLGWPPNVILLISASQVARNTGMSHQQPVPYFFL
jgi:hypothetical protein